MSLSGSRGTSEVQGNGDFSLSSQWLLEFPEMHSTDQGQAGTGTSSSGIVFSPSVISSLTLTCPGWEVSDTLQGPASVFARWFPGNALSSQEPLNPFMGQQGMASN